MDNDIILSIDDKTIILEKNTLFPKSMTYYEQGNEESVIVHYIFEINTVEKIEA